MSEYPFAFVAVVPAAMRGAADAMAAGLGMGPGNFRHALGAAGAPTHYAVAHVASERFVGFMAAQEGVTRAALADVTAPPAAGMLLIVDARGTRDLADLWPAALAAMELRPVEQSSGTV